MINMTRAAQGISRSAIRRTAALEASAVSIARVGDAPPGLVQPVRGPGALRGARTAVAQTGALKQKAQFFVIQRVRATTSTHINNNLESTREIEINQYT